MAGIINKGYQGNSKIKPAGLNIPFTLEQAKEYDKCMNNPVYFIKNYMKIVHLDYGLVNFDLYDYQEDLVETFVRDKRVIVLSSRQSGKSITTIGFFLWYTLFNEHKTIAILANKGDSARGLLERYQLAYENLPLWLQQGVNDGGWNKGSIHLENGCKIFAGSTSSDAARSKSINILFMDEFAFVPTNLADTFFKSTYPTISSGKTTQIIIVSTANGMNHFHKMWVNANKDKNSDEWNGYTPKRIDWWDVPGRDAEWKEKTIRETSAEQFEQEFGNEFLGTAGTLINPQVLRNMVHSTPLSDSENLKIYEMPQKKDAYAVVVDSSEGLGNDYHVANIFKITSYPYEQVAIYRSDTMDFHLLPDVIFNIGNMYNKAYVLCELNSTGESVSNVLYQDLEYENLLMTTMSGRKGQVLGGGFGGRVQMGVKTTKQSKRIGCSVLKTLVDNGRLIINDYQTISELTTFVRNKQSYEAESGCYDDCAMTLVLFAWMTNQQYFKDDMEKDLRSEIQKRFMDELEEMLVPFGHIEGGFNISEADPRYNVNTEEEWQGGLQYPIRW